MSKIRMSFAENVCWWVLGIMPKDRRRARRTSDKPTGITMNFKESVYWWFLRVPPQTTRSASTQTTTGRYFLRSQARDQMHNLECISISNKKMSRRSLKSSRAESVTSRRKTATCMCGTTSTRSEVSVRPGMRRQQGRKRKHSRSTTASTKRVKLSTNS